MHEQSKHFYLKCCHFSHLPLLDVYKVNFFVAVLTMDHSK